MTSQVAVLNLECVAVASDSALTVTRGADERTHSSSDKVFDLGDRHRVIVMVSGESRFMAVPYSVLIGEWGATLASSMSTVSEYTAAFTAWLGSRADLFDVPTQDAHFGWQLRDYYGMVQGNVLDALHEAGLSKEPWDSLSVQALVNRTVDASIEAIAGRADLPGLNARQDANYLDAHQELIEHSLLDATEAMPHTVASRWRLTKDLPALILAKDEPWAFDSVLVFVGYGADDVFPAYQAVDLHSMVNGQVRANAHEPVSATPSQPAIVAPFGQDEAIHTFLWAYNSDFLAAAHARLDRALDWVRDNSGIVTDTEGAELAFRRSAHEGLDEDFRKLSRQRFIDPMLDTIESLPRAEMARMAAALVGVQELRARSGSRQPSAGGPIDVAVISRYPGVQWACRKKLSLDQSTITGGTYGAPGFWAHDG